MEAVIKGIFDTVTVDFLSSINNSIRKFLLDIFQKLMNLMGTAMWEFWSEPLVKGILDVMFMLSMLSLAIGIIFLVGDIAEQVEQIDPKVIIFAIAKGFVFAVSARWLALSFFYGANLFISKLNLQLDASELQRLIDTNLLGSASAAFWTLLFLVIAIAVFFVLQLIRFAAMFIHIISVFAYIPFIVCGDSQKMKEWISTALSIAVTYAVQYLAFYGGMSLLITGQYVTGAIFFIAAFIAARELKAIGFNSGVKNSLQGASTMAVQTMMSLKAFGG